MDGKGGVSAVVTAKAKKCATHDRVWGGSDVHINPHGTVFRYKAYKDVY